MAGYINTVRAIVCFELPAREASRFCDFFFIDHLRIHRIYLLFDWSKLCFFLDVLVKDKIYLICVQIGIILMQWISLNDTLKKW